MSMARQSRFPLHFVCPDSSQKRFFRVGDLLLFHTKRHVYFFLLKALIVCEAQNVREGLNGLEALNVREAPNVRESPQRLIKRLTTTPGGLVLG
jgi:hypothetical protein